MKTRNEGSFRASFLRLYTSSFHPDKEEVLRKKQKPLPHYEPWRGGGGRGGAGGFGGGGGGRDFNILCSHMLTIKTQRQKIIE